MFTSPVKCINKYSDERNESNLHKCMIFNKFIQRESPYFLQYLTTDKKCPVLSKSEHCAAYRFVGGTEHVPQ